MIALDAARGLEGRVPDVAVPEPAPVDPWAEHGWSLTVGQTGMVLLVIAVVSVLLKVVGF